GLQLLVGETHHLLFEGVDRGHCLEHAFDFTLVLASKEFLQQWGKHIDGFFHSRGWGAMPGGRLGRMQRGHSTRKRRREKGERPRTPSVHAAVPLLLYGDGRRQLQGPL